MYLMYRHVDCLSKNELNRMPFHCLSRLHTMERDFSEFFDGRRFLFYEQLKECCFFKSLNCKYNWIFFISICTYQVSYTLNQTSNYIFTF